MGIIELILWFPLSVLGSVTKGIESLLFVLIEWYDLYVYSPLQLSLSPVVARIPRSLSIHGKDYDVFTANIVSWTRTVLVIPIAVCLKYHYFVVAFLLVLVHDFLDHVDGIVAKVQKKIYGQMDDPLLGGFMDAFCDKIVNVMSLWTILMVTDFSLMSFQSGLLFLSSCAVIIAYEFIIGVVRVQDYFKAFYEREYKIQTNLNVTSNTAAVMEGKLKEKLESMGIAFLCLAQGSVNIMGSYSGMAGVTCLLLSIRLAHASLQHKLKTRKFAKPIRKTEEDDEKTESRVENSQTTETPENYEKQTPCKEGEKDNKFVEKERPQKVTFDRNVSLEWDDPSDSRTTQEEMFESDPHLKDVFNRLVRQQSLPSFSMDGRVDKVYTIGCFDLFHDGHRRLLQRLKALGRQVIVGVHDSRSIFKLKKRVPIDSTERRMSDVKQLADVVYCIAGTDPTPFLSCIVDTSDGHSCMYVRGDDMQKFPAREFCEKIMPVTFLPYSKGVSSTQLRKEQQQSSKFGPHVKADDHDMLY